MATINQELEMVLEEVTKQPMISDLINSNYESIKNLDLQQILLRFVNKTLKDKQINLPISNFDKDFEDCTIFIYLLFDLTGEKEFVKLLDEKSLLERAKRFIKLVNKMELNFKICSAKDIANGNKLHLISFVGKLFLLFNYQMEWDQKCETQIESLENDLENKEKEIKQLKKELHKIDSDLMNQDNFTTNSKPTKKSGNIYTFTDIINQLIEDSAFLKYNIYESIRSLIKSLNSNNQQQNKFLSILNKFQETEFEGFVIWNTNILFMVGIVSIIKSHAKENFTNKIQNLIYNEILKFNGVNDKEIEKFFSKLFAVLKKQKIYTMQIHPVYKSLSVFFDQFRYLCLFRIELTERVTTYLFKGKSFLELKKTKKIFKKQFWKQFHLITNQIMPGVIDESIIIEILYEFFSKLKIQHTNRKYDQKEKKEQNEVKKEQKEVKKEQNEEVKEQKEVIKEQKKEKKKVKENQELLEICKKIVNESKKKAFGKSIKLIINNLIGTKSKKLLQNYFGLFNSTYISGSVSGSGSASTSSSSISSYQNENSSFGKEGEEEILSSCYQLLKLYLNKNDSDFLCKALDNQISGESSKNLSFSLFYFFDFFGLSLTFINFAIRYEILSCNKNQNSLFKPNHISSLLTTIYTQLYGEKYIQILIGDLIQEILKNKQKQEIEKKKLSNNIMDNNNNDNSNSFGGGSGGGGNKKNTDDNFEKNKNLGSNLENFENNLNSDANFIRKYFYKIIDLLFSKINDFPKEIKIIANFYQKELGKNYPNALINALGSLVFTKFICPTIISPENHNLVYKQVKPNERKTLINISAVIQKLGVGSIFPETKPSLLSLNKDIGKLAEKRLEFYRLISEHDENLDLKKYLKPFSQNENDQNNNYYFDPIEPYQIHEFFTRFDSKKFINSQKLSLEFLVQIEKIKENFLVKPKDKLSNASDDNEKFFGKFGKQYLDDFCEKLEKFRLFIKSINQNLTPFNAFFDSLIEKPQQKNFKTDNQNLLKNSENIKNDKTITNLNENGKKNELKIEKNNSKGKHKGKGKGKGKGKSNGKIKGKGKSKKKNNNEKTKKEKQNIRKKSFSSMFKRKNKTDK
ncbi:ras gtpase-activating protein [Anaeramoeba flamelloides]|uniref:Ras gtpase-activating protein n=1 Tax=Anaeramoeba flamelloides TaxID=1746091 RepID=A0AAV8AHF9_9EUKA|nr:ras gtpase-activating protein [Anaeramoeba flamelloides]